MWTIQQQLELRGGNRIDSLCSDTDVTGGAVTSHPASEHAHLSVLWSTSVVDANATRRRAAVTRVVGPCRHDERPLVAVVTCYMTSRLTLSPLRRPLPVSVCRTMWYLCIIVERHYMVLSFDSLQYNHAGAPFLARSAKLPEGLYILPMFFLYFFF